MAASPHPALRATFSLREKGCVSFSLGEKVPDEVGRMRGRRA